MEQVQIQVFLYWMYEKCIIIFFIAQTRHNDIVWLVYSPSLQERELAQAELDGKLHLNSVACKEKGFSNLTDWMLKVLLKKSW